MMVAPTSRTIRLINLGRGNQIKSTLYVPLPSQIDLGIPCRGETGRNDIGRDLLGPITINHYFHLLPDRLLEGRTGGRPAA